RYRSQLLIQWRSFTVDVELEHGSGDRGVLVAHGDQGGGYALYVLDDNELVFVHNGYGKVSVTRCGPLPEGSVRVRLDVTAPGNWRWNVRVLVADAAAGGTDEMGCVGEVADLVMLGAMAPFEGIDVGID